MDHDVLEKNKSKTYCRDNGRYLLVGQPKVNKVKIYLPSLKFMKRPQTKFHADTMSNAQVIRSKKSQNSSLGQTFFAAQFFSLFDIL